MDRWIKIDFCNMQIFVYLLWSKYSILLFICGITPWLLGDCLADISRTKPKWNTESILWTD